MHNRCMMQGKKDVKVYTASTKCLEDPELFDAWLLKVPEDRRKSVEELRNPAVRRQSLAAGALLVCALRDYAGTLDDGAGTLDDGVGTAKDDALTFEDGSGTAEGMRGGEAGRADFSDPRRIRIAKEEDGRPYLQDCPQIHFSLSHSGSRVMCAVSQVQVGCDVQAAGRTDADLRRIGKVLRALAPGEQERIRSDPDAFYRIWTLKESFLKLTGKGLALPMSSFEIRLDPPGIVQDIISEEIDMREYAPESAEEQREYRFACMACGGEIAEEMTRIDLARELQAIRSIRP